MTSINVPYINWKKVFSLLLIFWRPIVCTGINGNLIEIAHGFT